MLVPALPHRFPGRRLLLALGLWCAALALVGLITPARGLASNAVWTPASGSLVKTPRTCPSPSVAPYYDTACWAVSPDHTNPFYSPQSPYGWGQCTYWALELRPDLWSNRARVDPNANDWTAYTWPQHAALEGLTVDHAPAAGAVIVWPQSADNDTGHVAYVQSVGVALATGDDLVPAGDERHHVRRPLAGSGRHDDDLDRRGRPGTGAGHPCPRENCRPGGRRTAHACVPAPP